MDLAKAQNREIPKFEFRIKYGQSVDAQEMVEHVPFYSGDIHFIAPFFVIDLK